MTPDAATFRFDDGPLLKLLKALESPNVVRVGVFGGGRKAAGEKRKNGSDGGRNGGRKAGRQAAGTTNAEVGFLMEFGAPLRNIPARSWLRMPIMTKIEKIVKDSAKFFEEAAKTGDAHKFLTIVGINAEKWIGLAFDTRGFGAWAPNKPATIARKGSDTPLIDTGQLRRAVVSMVVPG